jgi:mannose-6-phosphate isomerase-like protein (cupin superfamily)
VDFSVVEDSLDKVNIRHALDAIDEYWSQKILGEANGSLYKVAKGIGETHWHKHDDQDELFIIYKGHLTIQLRDRDIELYQDEMFIVPRGVEHRPKADQEVEILVVGLNITSNEAGGKPNIDKKPKLTTKVDQTH